MTLSSGAIEALVDHNSVSGVTDSKPEVQDHAVFFPQMEGLLSVNREKSLRDAARGVNRTRVPEMMNALRVEFAKMKEKPLTEESLLAFENEFRTRMKGLVRRTQEPHYLTKFRREMETLLQELRERIAPNTVVPVLQAQISEDVVEVVSAPDPMEAYTQICVDLDQFFSAKQPIFSRDDYRPGQFDDEKLYDEVCMWINEYARNPEAESELLRTFETCCAIEKPHFKMKKSDNRLGLLLLKKQVLAAILGSRVSGLSLANSEGRNVSAVSKYVSELIAFGKIRLHVLERLSRSLFDLKRKVEQFESQGTAEDPEPAVDDIVYPTDLTKSKFLLNSTLKRLSEVQLTLDKTVYSLSAFVESELGHTPQEEELRLKALSFLGSVKLPTLTPEALSPDESYNQGHSIEVANFVYVDPLPTIVPKSPHEVMIDAGVFKLGRGWHEAIDRFMQDYDLSQKLGLDQFADSNQILHENFDLLLASAIAHYAEAPFDLSAPLEVMKAHWLILFENLAKEQGWPKCQVKAASVPGKPLFGFLSDQAKFFGRIGVLTTFFCSPSEVEMTPPNGQILSVDVSQTLDNYDQLMGVTASSEKPSSLFLAVDELPAWDHVKKLNTQVSMAEILKDDRVLQYLTQSTINDRWESRKTYEAIKAELLDDGGFEGAFAFAPEAKTIREYIEIVEPRNPALAARMKAEFQMFGIQKPKELNAIIDEVVKGKAL